MVVEKNKTHKNIGILRVNRRQGRTRLVGSASAAQTYIGLELMQGHAISDEISKEKFYPKESQSIVEVSMTPMQWGELLSSFGMAAGVPCTIECVNGKRVAQTYKTEPLADYYSRHTAKTLSEFKKKYEETMDEVVDILENKKNIAKKDREKILSNYKTLTRLMEDTLPFIQRRMIEDTEEHIAKSATQFKANMQELFRNQSKISQIGL